MVITNARLRNKEGLWDIAVKDGKFSAITPAGTAPVQCASIDAAGKLVIPPYVDSHIHLDYAFTAGIPHHNMSGTLFEGIKIWSEHKIQSPLTEEYIRI